MEKFVIDGTNVCWWYAQAYTNDISVKPLFAIIQAILENGDDFYCVFDASMYFELNQKGKPVEEKMLSDLVNKYPDNFFIVTGSSRADGVVLHDADVHNRRIVTNDIYKDYRDKYGWLSDKHNDRLLQGNLQRSGLITIDKLSYGRLSITENLDNAYEKIVKELDLKNSPEINSLENEIIRTKKILNQLEQEIDLKSDKLQTLLTEMNAADEKEKKHDAIIKKLVKSEKEYKNKLETMRQEYDDLVIKLEKVGFLSNFEILYQEKNVQINDLDRMIDAKKAEIKKYDDEKKTILKEYELYKSSLTKQEQRESQEKSKLSNDQECIKKAQKAIAKFIEQFGDMQKQSQRFYGEDFIKFDGSSWDVAVSALKIAFQKKPICENCYERINHSFLDKCNKCQSTKITKNPQKIWDIINSCAPKK